MSISSFHSLQTQIDSESMPMSNDYQPLPGDPNFITFTQEDIANLVAAYQSQSDKLSPELRAQMDEARNYGPLTKMRWQAQPMLTVNGSNYDELAAPQQLEGTSSDSQYIQDPQASFPTLENFTAPVANLPQMPQNDPTLYYPPQPDVPQASPQGGAWPQHEYDHGYFMNGPPALCWTFKHRRKATHGPNMDMIPLPIITSNLTPVAGPSYPHQQPQTEAGPSYPYQQLEPQTTAGSIQRQLEDAPLQTVFHVGSSVELSSSALDQTGFCKAFSSSSVAPTTRKRRRQNDKDSVIKQGKFGPYTLADASATVMVMPVHDPKPVDISSRRTHDPHWQSPSDEEIWGDGTG
ncbi:hypothetical protein F4604DRAFT_1682638 [Suillus subluteus]|nr:hypothetical protein F4604DRAFT_1682638 [Suillus subluteus]